MLDTETWGCEYTLVLFKVKVKGDIWLRSRSLTAENREQLVEHGRAERMNQQLLSRELLEETKPRRHE
ncbi:hypothetical protein EYF80_025194 [Liparis tanakae]|uniref:Uncharacterized protein n=1 Tax=Liparis tanakae TaxID=230148 RepID=A0A4Z2HFB9_9TELE|nr:hypothetical protein EYF80_025194 [Liparis tanakae]